MRLVARLQGFDRLSLVTKKLTTAAQQGLQFGVSEAGLILETAAKENVPVLTGNLRDHIHTELMESTAERQVVAVTPAYDEPNKYGFDPAYARRIEYGFEGADSLGRVYHQPAQPYMRPAWDEHKDEAVQAIKDSVLEEVRAAHQ